MQYIILTILLLIHTLNAQNVTINTLNKNDENFKQLIKEIEINHQRLAQKKELFPLSFYFYRVKEHETLYTIAAKLNLTYDSIATLNNLAFIALLEKNQLIILPNLSAIYLEELEEDPLFLTIKNRLQTNEYFKAVYQDPLKSMERTIRVYPGQKFSPKERLTFLSGFFLWPITGERIITSDYGIRVDPIAHKNHHHHNGIDLRLNLGSPVYASRAGTVTQIENNNLLGIHIVIQHDHGFETIYGHLDKSLVQLNQYVRSGEQIAISGNTGVSTGPHLHFEIRKYGITLDPKNFFVNH